MIFVTQNSLQPRAYVVHSHGIAELSSEFGNLWRVTHMLGSDEYVQALSRLWTCSGHRSRLSLTMAATASAGSRPVNLRPAVRRFLPARHS